MSVPISLPVCTNGRLKCIAFERSLFSSPKHPSGLVFAENGREALKCEAFRAHEGAISCRDELALITEGGLAKCRLGNPLVLLDVLGDCRGSAVAVAYENRPGGRLRIAELKGDGSECAVVRDRAVELGELSWGPKLGTALTEDRAVLVTSGEGRKLQLAEIDLDGAELIDVSEVEWAGGRPDAVQFAAGGMTHVALLQQLVMSDGFSGPLVSVSGTEPIELPSPSEVAEHLELSWAPRLELISFVPLLDSEGELVDWVVVYRAELRAGFTLNKVERAGGLFFTGGDEGRLAFDWATAVTRSGSRFLLAVGTSLSPMAALETKLLGPLSASVVCAELDVYGSGPEVVLYAENAISPCAFSALTRFRVEDGAEERAVTEARAVMRWSVRSAG